MRNQNNQQKNALMVLWSLFHFGKSNTTVRNDKKTDAGGQFELYANYPNPFSTITILYFALMNDSHVQIDVNDVSGKKIMTLIKDDFEAGIQRVPLYKVTNGVTLSAGSYSYKIIVSNSYGKFSQEKPLNVI